MSFNGQLPSDSDDNQQTAAQQALLQAALAGAAAKQPQVPAGMPQQAPQGAPVAPSAFPLMQAANQGAAAPAAPQAATVNNPAITQAVLSKLLAQPQNRVAKAEGPDVIRPDGGFGRIIWKP